MTDKKILDSWKAISAYLSRDVRTCIRWEKELGLPVHRINDKSSRSKVYAYKEEIDRWLKKRKNGSGRSHIFSGIKNAGWIGAAAAFVLLVALFIQYKQNIRFQAGEKHYSLAIFPFENKGDSEYDEYFSAGLLNSLISQFSLIRQLQVIPAEAAASAQKRIGDFSQAGTELEADFIMTGSARRSQEEFEIHIKVTQISTGNIVFNRIFKDKLDELLNTQADICNCLTRSLKIEPRDTTNTLSPNSYANDSFLKGLYLSDSSNTDPLKLYIEGTYFNGYYTKESNDLAIKFFKKAMEEDPNFAHAFLGLALSYACKINFFDENEIEWLNQAEQLADKAQELSPDLPEYFGNMLLIKLIKFKGFGIGTLENALEIAKQGLELYSLNHRINVLTASAYFHIYGISGRDEEFQKALDYFERSHQLNRFSVSGNFSFVELLMLNKQYERALNISRMTEKIESVILCQYSTAEIYYYMGDLEQSRKAFMEMRDSEWETMVDLHLAKIAVLSGKGDEALAIAKKTILLAPESHIDFLQLASIYFGLGMEEQAFQHLDKDLSQGELPIFPFISRKYIEIDPLFSPYLDKIISKYF